MLSMLRVVNVFWRQANGFSVVHKRDTPKLPCLNRMISSDDVQGRIVGSCQIGLTSLLPVPVG